MKLLKNNNKGFTLIELLVVVAIISLLTSIVLASLKDARDKAKMSAYRQELYQLINALELYKADNLNYPQGHYVKNYNNVNVGSIPNLPSTLSNYIESFPKIRDTLPGGINTYYGYYANLPSSVEYRCGSQSILPPYIIVTTKNLKISSGALKDWEDAYARIPPSNWFLFSPGFKCYSLK